MPQIDAYRQPHVHIPSLGNKWNFVLFRSHHQEMYAHNLPFIRLGIVRHDVSNSMQIDVLDDHYTKNVP